MRVCMLTRTLPAHAIGGMELHIQTLAVALAAKGIDVTIITTAHPTGTLSEERDGVHIHYIPNTTPGKYSRAWWRESVLAFRALHARTPFDLIHGQSAGGYALLRAGVHLAYRIPFVTSLHGTAVDEIKTRLRLGFNLRAFLGLVKNAHSYLFGDRVLLPRPDAIIATSDSQVEVITKWHPVDPAKVHLVYNGIDVHAFSPRPADEALRASLGLVPGQPLLFSVARLKKEKGLQNVIAVMPDLAKAFPSIVLLVGGEGEYKAELAAQANALGVGDRVRFLGKIDFAALPKYFSLCDVFINSTIRENGYDLTIPQGMASGKPVVVSDIRSVVASVVTDGVDGFIYPRNDLEKLAGLVARLLNDAGLRGQIGNKARATAVASFSLETMAGNTISVYNKILRKGTP